jgi:hypothetical protein
MWLWLDILICAISTGLLQLPADPTSPLIHSLILLWMPSLA